MSKQTPQNETVSLEADYCFHIPTEYLGDFMVGVENGSGLIGMGRVIDGSENGLVNLLGREQKQLANLYINVSPDHIVKVDGEFAREISGLVEEVYSRGLDVLSARRKPTHPLIDALLGAIPVYGCLRAEAKSRELDRMNNRLSSPTTDLVSSLIEYGKKVGVVKPDYFIG